MKKLPAIMLAVGTAVALPAFPDSITTYYYWDAPSDGYVKRTTVIYESPTVTYVEPAAVTPVGTIPVAYTERQIVITAPRLSEQERITDEVIDRIADDSRISGRVGVETSRNNRVTLSGRVGTRLQADRASRHAMSVQGVREVDNQLRAQVGG
jgi:hypothetical protein